VYDPLCHIIILMGKSLNYSFLIYENGDNRTSGSHGINTDQESVTEGTGEEMERWSYNYGSHILNLQRSVITLSVRSQV